MNYYSDKENEAAARLLFLLFQIGMVLIVYGFIYTAMVAVKVSVERYGTTPLAFVPESIATLLFAFVLFKTRHLFNRGKRLRAVAWTMAWASLIIVLLYWHLTQLAPVA